jgi:inner membrane protein
VCIAGAVAVLYAYLYMVLMNEDYALLVGAIGLFVALAIVMFITRKIDWYAVGSDEASTQRDR